MGLAKKREAKKVYLKWYTIPKSGKTKYICAILMLLEAYDEKHSVTCRDVSRELEKRALPELGYDLTSGRPNNSVSSELSRLSRIRGAILASTRSDEMEPNLIRYWYKLPFRGYIPPFIVEIHLELCELLEKHPDWTPSDYNDYWKKKEEEIKESKKSTLEKMIEKISD
jgi:hypothetical protein